MNKISFLTIMMVLFSIEQCQSAPISLFTLTPSLDTILAGERILVTATVKDSLGNDYPSRSLSWSLGVSLYDGDLFVNGNGATFTATKAYHTDTIKVAIFIENYMLLSKSKITILPNSPYKVHIEKDSIPASLWRTDSTDTVRISRFDSTFHLYAIERDTFGNYIGRSKAAVWTLLQTGIVSIAPSSTDTGRIDITPLDSGICQLVVTDSTLIPDTVYFIVAPRTQVNTVMPIRLTKGNTNSFRELYDLKGRKIDTRNDIYSGVYISKEVYLCSRKVRVAASLRK